MPPSPAGVLPLDPRTGGVISPIIAAALFIKLLGLLTPRQPEKVDILEQALPVFACKRSLAMRFRGLLRGSDPDALDDWIRDAVDCGIHTMQKFAVKLRYDINAVRNAICKPWSNGRTEGRKCSNAQCMGEPVSHCSDLGCAPSVRSRITKREPEPNNGQRDSGLLHGSNA
jgi:Transposase